MCVQNPWEVRGVGSGLTSRNDSHLNLEMILQNSPPTPRGTITLEATTRAANVQNPLLRLFLESGSCLDTRRLENGLQKSETAAHVSCLHCVACQ